MYNLDNHGLVQGRLTDEIKQYIDLGDMMTVNESALRNQNKSEDK